MIRPFEKVELQQAIKRYRSEGFGELLSISHARCVMLARANDKKLHTDLYSGTVDVLEH